MAVLTENQARIVARIASSGALTTRRIVQEFGPKPSWQRLLDEQYLREVHTVYGPVLGLHDQTFEFYRADPNVKTPPYLKAPSSLADRAFQMDALAVLQREGYKVQKIHHKGGGRTSPETYTSQIVSIMLRVPPAVAEDMAERSPVKPYIDHGIDRFRDQRGYPYLYASVSSGGIRLPQLKSCSKCMTCRSGRGPIPS